ncbi:hypothetical protein HMI55_005070 [Coelomomyces lativittatus]|nr:hypothetical protein HMI55_005070 [Coelomomyces lativittatus]
MNNFYILNEVGHILFSQNYKGEPLDKSVIIGFSSSLPNLCLSLLNDNVQQVNCNNSKLIFSFSNKVSGSLTSFYFYFLFLVNELFTTDLL